MHTLILAAPATRGATVTRLLQLGIQEGNAPSTAGSPDNRPVQGQARVAGRDQFSITARNSPVLALHASRNVGSTQTTCSPRGLSRAMGYRAFTVVDRRSGRSTA
jgi:hypothetical protein